MKMKKVVNLTILALCLCFVSSIGLFFYNAEKSYNINNNFTSIPLQFNPDDSTSTYKTDNAEVIVKDGFVKGIQKDDKGNKNIVIRALGPLPDLEIKGYSDATISIYLENINPDLYANSIKKSNHKIVETKVNTLQFSIKIKKDEIESIKPDQTNIATNPLGDSYVILGDNRDGYDTFEKIIQQVNAGKPIFVIDNGDLVFSGKPNQYRLFDKMAAGISTTLCTTLGNHDIRDDGRSIYTMLYGPAYYSFDYSNDHFIFLDSSPGWLQKHAISDVQYKWLESDLIKAQGKDIFVISHIPPIDPRALNTNSKLPNYVINVKESGSWLEQKLEDYSESKKLDHGFKDAAEALKFENLMSKYKVDTVYLSHIHSYMDYSKDGVRYLITGGAGAELLTENSYYHYIIAKVGDSKTTTVMELPSPANSYVARYIATIKLFTHAIFDENPLAGVFFIIGFILLLILIVYKVAIKIYSWKKRPINNLGKWLSDSWKYSVKHFKELFFNKKDN